MMTEMTAILLRKVMDTVLHPQGTMPLVQGIMHLVLGTMHQAQVGFWNPNFTLNLKNFVLIKFLGYDAPSYNAPSYNAPSYGGGGRFKFKIYIAFGLLQICPNYANIIK